MIGNLKIIGSTATGDAKQSFDERHYFLVPDPRSAEGYVLLISRCLPEGVPPINELPKRRVLHLPNADAEPMLMDLLMRQAQAEELARPSEKKTLANRTKEIADQIDAIDDKVFHGILLIGGLVAVFNPLAGAAIAAKSLIPSLGMYASKYGLRMAEESLSHAELQKRAKQAEKNVRAQFKSSQTESFSNPLLGILARALVTNEDQFDPMFELHNYIQSDLSTEHRHWLTLTSTAILDVFDDATKSPRAAHKAGLGSEDIRFLELLRTISKQQP